MICSLLTNFTEGPAVGPAQCPCSEGCVSSSWRWRGCVHRGAVAGKALSWPWSHWELWSPLIARTWWNPRNSSLIGLGEVLALENQGPADDLKVSQGFTGELSEFHQPRSSWTPHLIYTRGLVSTGGHPLVGKPQAFLRWKWPLPLSTACVLTEKKNQGRNDNIGDFKADRK